MTKAAQQATEKITTTEAIRRALESGIDQPKEIVAYCKKHFDIDVKPTTVSTTKYHLQKKSSVGTKTQVVAAKRTTKPAAAISYDVPPEELALAMRELVRKYGTDEVVRTAKLAGMFA